MKVKYLVINTKKQNFARSIPLGYIFRSFLDFCLSLALSLTHAVSLHLSVSLSLSARHLSLSRFVPREYVLKITS